MENSIKIWDNLSSNEKMSFGERFITHESNLKVWDKLFNDLSELKKQRVISKIESFSKIEDHCVYLTS